MIIGNDISRYQGNIDFQKMKAAGSAFVYMRLGVGFNIDIKYKENREKAKAAGIPWGHYWLPWATTRTGALIDQYLFMVGGDWGDLPPAIDVETSGLGLGLFYEWVARVTKESGRKPVFYTRASHFDGYKDAKGIKAWLGENTDLWVAHYTYSPDKKPYMPRGSWKDYLLHQYSADENSLGKTYGVSSKAIDMDYFNGDPADFVVFARMGDAEDPTEPEQPPDDGKQYAITIDDLRGRTTPRYIAGQSALIFEKGERLELADLPCVPDPVENITWQPVIMYVSKKWIRDV